MTDPFKARLHVLRRTDIGDGAKLLAIYILDLQGLRSGACTMGNTALAEHLDCTVRSLRRRSMDLEFAGLLKGRESEPRRWRIAVPKDAWVEHPTPVQGRTLASGGEDTSVRGGGHQRPPHLRGVLEEELETQDARVRLSQNRERGVLDIYEALRTAFYVAWREHYPKGTMNHQPRPINPEKGYALEACGWLYDQANGDVGRARNGARLLVTSMFKSENLYKGRPWKWKSVAGDPGKFFASPSNPARERRDRDLSESYERKMREAERDAAPAEVGKLALELLKGGGGGG